MNEKKVQDLVKKWINKVCRDNNIVLGIPCKEGGVWTVSVSYRGCVAPIGTIKVDDIGEFILTYQSTSLIEIRKAIMGARS